MAMQDETRQCDGTCDTCSMECYVGNGVYDDGETEQPHVHCWSNATGVLGERWCLDCDWLLMPDGTTIQ